MPIGNVAFISPHADDETLSMGYAATYYLRAGFDAHFLLGSRGPVTAESLRLDGALPCRWSEHPYSHSPEVEGYTLPTLDDIGLARWNEFKAATFAMSTIAPATSGVPSGRSWYYEGGLETNFGCDGCGSSTAPVTENAIARARAVLEPFVDAMPPNTHFRTMSPTDDHPDHAAWGIALHRMKLDPVWGPKVGDAMFFVSRLYWGPPRPADVLAEACSWFPADTGSVGYAPIVDHLRNKVVKCYKQWVPGSAWAVGAGHSVPSQFDANFGPLASVSNLWHPANPAHSFPGV